MRDLEQALGYTAHSHTGEVKRCHQQPSIDFVLKVLWLFNVMMDQLAKDEL